MTQDRESGATAAKFGHAVATLIGNQIGAKKLSTKANEFELNGERITIRMAHIGTDQVGALYDMLNRVKTVIGAFEVLPNEYELLSLSPDIYQKHMRDSKTGKG